MPRAAGSRFGAYEITAAIGAGGMGEVYRARDTKLGRDVAIKVLPSSVASDPERLKRFEQEAKTAGALNHPNLVTIYELGVIGGLPYIVMELVDGETLRQRLTTPPAGSRSGGSAAIPVRKSLDYATQVAQGLAAAHERGIVHRDLKPENLIVTPDGRLKILDFGLAKALAPQTGTGSLETGLFEGTSPGTVLGTVSYMAPEQVRGGATIDQRADIFALGAILYEMLAGRRAFLADSPVETMNAILHEDPPDLSRDMPEIPPGLARLVQRCLEKRPAERFQSARDLAFHLTALSADSSQRSGVQAALPARTRMSPRLLIGAAAVVGVAFGLFIGAAMFRRPVSEPARIESFTYSGSDSSPAASPDGRTIAFSSYRTGKGQIWLKQIDGGGETARTPGPDDRNPRFSPDGASLLFLRQEGSRVDLFRTAVLGGEERRILSDVLAADWSPDGSAIAFAALSPQDESIVGTVRTDGSDRREVLRLRDWRPLGVAWSPDGRWVSSSFVPRTGTTGTRVMLVPAAGGEARLLRDPAASGVASSHVWTGSSREIVYAASAAGNSVVLSEGNRRVVAHDVQADRARTLFWTMKAVSGLDIVAPGTLILDGTERVQNLRAVSLDRSPKASATADWLTRGSSIDRQPAFSPDGNWLILASNRSRNLDLWALSRRDGAVRRITDDASADWDPAYTPDGRDIIWSSNRGGHFEIWMAAADGSGARQISQDGVDAENPTMTKDGRWVVFSSANPEKRGIWKVHPDGTGAAPVARGSFTLPEVSPDGRYVAFLVNPEGQSRRLLVRRIEDGAEVPFNIRVDSNGTDDVNYGRLRWLPDGKAIAFCALGPDRVAGVFAQDFVPGQDTSATRRKLAGFFPDARAESFGMAPDGVTIVVSGVERRADLLLAHGIPDLLPARRGKN